MINNAAAQRRNASGIKELYPLKCSSPRLVAALVAASICASVSAPFAGDTWHQRTVIRQTSEAAMIATSYLSFGKVTEWKGEQGPEVSGNLDEYRRDRLHAPRAMRGVGPVSRMPAPTSCLCLR